MGLLESKRSRDNEYERYSIFDIYDAVVRYDELSFVHKYPHTRYGHGVDAQKIDEQRNDIQKEYEEYEQALSSPVKHVKEYPQDEAEQRVRDCYYGHFPHGVDTLLPIKNYGNRLPIKTQTYNISDIHEAIEYYDEKKLLQKYPEDGGPGSDKLRKLIEENNTCVRTEYEEVKSKLRKYPTDEAKQRVRDCFEDGLDEEVAIFPVENVEMRVEYLNQTYDIFYIHKMYLHFVDKESPFLPYFKCRPQHEVSPEVIRAKRVALEEEYQQSKRRLGGCSRSEAERRVRDCFVGTMSWDNTDIFSTNEGESGIPRTQQTYDIFDIKKAVDYFDLKTLRGKYLDEKYPESEEMNSRVDEKRGKIKEEYEEATEEVEIDNGSGFIIHEHFIITNKHVIEDALCDNTKEICISNAAIRELSCEVAHYDAGKDLALLYCRELNLKQNGISPLQLSNHSLLPGMEICSFGYPISHKGNSAVFVYGYVSGFEETFNQLCSSGHTMAVLNCSLNPGNSGGPVLCWVKGQLKVVGIATQKHFKEILTLEERTKIEKIRKSFQTSVIPSVSDEAIKYASAERERSNDFSPRPDPCQTPMFLLTLKLYDALETHSQFNLSNAVPGHCMIEFVKEVLRTYKGEATEELAEVVQWSEDHVNVLPSGNHSASECCIQ